MSEKLRELADKLNISLEFTFTNSEGVKHCEPSDELLRFLIESMGYGADGHCRQKSH